MDVIETFQSDNGRFIQFATDNTGVEQRIGQGKTVDHTVRFKGDSFSELVQAVLGVSDHVSGYDVVEENPGRFKEELVANDDARRTFLSQFDDREELVYDFLLPLLWTWRDLVYDGVVKPE